MIEVHSEHCPQNHTCPVINVCPVNAISQESAFSAPVIDEENCIDCGQCSGFCPVFRNSDR